MRRAKPSSAAVRLGAARAWPCVLAFSLTAAREAAADPKLQAVGEVSVGYTDNIQAAPSDPLPGVAARSPGAFLVLRPGLVVASASARSIHRLKYSYTYDLFFQHTNASTSSNQLEYRAFFDLSPRFSLVTGASAIQSNQYSAITLTAPGAGTVNATPSGSGAFLAVTADELLSWEVARDWRAYESMAVTEQTPLFDTVAPRTFAPAWRLGAERTFRSDAVGAEARADYSIVDGSARPDGSPLGPQHQLIASAVGLWRHDWGRSFASRVEAGALRVMRLDSGKGLWEPAGSASLAYVTEEGDATLTLGRTVTTNPLLGQTLLIDEARLRGALPLTKKGELLVAASAGYQRGRLLDENVTLAAHVDAILADVGLGWQITPLWLLGLRYQHIEQITDTRVPPLPLSFVRNSVMLGIAFRFPAESEMPRAYRAPQRVDRTDEIRDAVEPTQGGVQPRPPGGT